MGLPPLTPGVSLTPGLLLVLIFRVVLTCTHAFIHVFIGALRGSLVSFLGLLEYHHNTGFLPFIPWSYCFDVAL